MRDVKFPTQPDRSGKTWQYYIKAPTTKKALFTMVEPIHPRDCKNCGGIGVMYLFIANGGPFINVPGGIAKFADGKWWSGENIGGMCDVCKGTGIDPNYVEKPAKQREMELKDFTV